MDNSIMQIHCIMAYVFTMGANDSEIPDLNQILSKIQAGDLEPAEGLKKAHEIFNRKQSYH